MVSEISSTAVLLLAFGGADSVDSVEPFLNNILSPRTPSPQLIEDARKRYMLIGGYSPITEITMMQARMLGMRVNRGRKEKIPVYVGMKNWNPYIKDTIKEMAKDGVKKVIAVIMSPYV
ncbi:MAG: ferrochelatase, partial [Thermodesulfobacteriota bacterium]